MIVDLIDNLNELKNPPMSHMSNCVCGGVARDDQLRGLDQTADEGENQLCACVLLLYNLSHEGLSVLSQ